MLFAFIMLGAPLTVVAATPSSQPASAPAQQSLERQAFLTMQTHEHDPIVAAAAAEWGLDPFMLKALLLVESGMKAGAVNQRSGARGIAQFTGGGRRGIVNLRQRRGLSGRDARFSASDAMDPKRAIPAAAELIAHLFDEYGRDGGLTAFNTGPWGGVLVRRVGYWSARPRVGPFLLLVLRQANKLRTEAGLPPLPPPAKRAKPAPKLVAST